MAEKIINYKFKPGLKLEIEILPIQSLYKKHKNILTVPHRADFYHVLFIRKGKGQHLIDFQPIQLSSNTLLFIKKGKVHFFDKSGKLEGDLILFTEDFFCRNEDDLTFLHSTILFNDLLDNTAIKTSASNTFFSDVIEAMKKELNNQAKEFHHEMLQNLLHNLLMAAHREKRAQGYRELPKGADLDYTLLFNELIDKYFLTRKSVNEYAANIHITEKRLSKATSNILGKSPKELISQRVVLEAKRLLVHTNQPIKEIAFHLGFVETTNFIKYFKSHTGSTPTEFRESHL
ncbi:MAG: AraC family transcriptional regulator [Bacteroidetes bacterium OLB12]|nr:MAG: AraC family transcriptional regulator [Bacteroidetes bacterium OLB12]